ncbi:TetR/AcrR family transcriptional regulator [Streptomyces sp. PKU-MA01144]|uniref:TetR/AcrR family transcriptional regulator n=1 Tax=Streptomyces sp. PKU-MA01144 TaxID=2729138 RepID=UPI00147F3092|nr:TetR/AcrR family transcriptional regulator [Streptomyces sp. PKU-MA01144]NNJ03261.1 TetR/AcrR family transcriptional regulator [Streptomyces sp. PKU-MA01144]
MPRPPDLAKRRELLERIYDYVVRNGLSGLSLRPLAEELGTSDRMLLYYFGTKERLITEVLAMDDRRPMPRVRDRLETAGPPEDAAGMRRLMEEVWQLFTDPDLRASFPLHLEVMSDSLLHPERYGPVMQDIVTQWTDLLTSALMGTGVPEGRARSHATLLVGAIFGLLLAPLTNGRWDDATAAYHDLLDCLEPAWRAAR